MGINKSQRNKVMANSYKAHSEDWLLHLPTTGQVTTEGTPLRCILGWLEARDDIPWLGGNGGSRGVAPIGLR
jgi:hypothetical protein